MASPGDPGIVPVGFAGEPGDLPVPCVTPVFTVAPMTRTHLVSARLTPLALAGIALLASSCSSTSSTASPVTAAATLPVAVTAPPADTGVPTTQPTDTTVAVQDPGVSSALAPLTGWSVPTYEATDSRSLEADSFERDNPDGTRSEVSCAPQGLPPMTGTFDSFPAFGFSGSILPGLVIQGAGVESGDLRVVPLDRAPATLVSSLSSGSPTSLVDAPTTATLTDAVATLQRDADARITGIDVVPAQVMYERTETFSFEQSRFALDTSLRYHGSFDASMQVNFAQEKGVEKYSVVVRYVQPMYTIRMAADSIVSPGDYFAAGVTPADLSALQATGAMGPGNQPLVIDQVTYGRVMYFTLTSTEATSAQDLMVALDAANEQWDGGVEMTDEQRSLLRNSRIAMLAIGGDQGLAEDAIRTGDIGEYFGSANTTTAAALSFSLRTLDGTKVEVADSVSASRLLCDKTLIEEQAPTFTAAVSGVVGRVEVFVNGTRVIDASHTPDNLLTFTVNEFAYGSGSAGINAYFQSGSNVVEVKYTNLACINAQFTIKIQVDGRNVVNESMPPKCAFTVTWTYDVNPSEGTATKRP